MEGYKSKVNSDGSLAHPIYDPPNEFLFGNAVYMKGAWVLHMLRNEVGYDSFKTIIRRYFENYKYNNVRTRDFMLITEQVTHQSFSDFFDQWLNYGGIPILLGEWEQQNNMVSIIVEQFQERPVYQFDLEILIKGLKKDSLIMIPIQNKRLDVKIDFNDSVTEIIIDPENKILNINNSPLYSIPKESKILRIFPNPARSQVSILYKVSKSDHIKIMIYDMLGQLVAKLVDEKKTPGIYEIEWQGDRYASGTYFCTMKINDQIDKRKMTLVK
jgi:aminopeptidase N